MHVSKCKKNGPISEQKTCTQTQIIQLTTTIRNHTHKNKFPDNCQTSFDLAFHNYLRYLQITHGANVANVANLANAADVASVANAADVAKMPA